MLDAIVDFLSDPHEAVLEVLQNIYLPGPFRGILFPASPVRIIIEIVLPGACLENSVPGFGP